MVPVPLRPEDLDVIYGYPLFNEHSYPTQIDTMEYCLGLQRGEINANSKSCTVPRRIPLRAEVIMALRRDEWALCPDEETLELLAKNLLENGERPTDARRSWETVSEYTYTLFFREDILTLNSPRGPCKSGDTLITSKFRPTMAISSATRYTIDDISKDKLPRMLSLLLSCNHIFLRTVLRKSFLEQNTTLGRPRVFQALDDVEAGTPEEPAFCYVKYED